MRERVLDEARNDVQSLRHELASLEALQRAALGSGSTLLEAHDWIEAQGLSQAESVWVRCCRWCPAGSRRWKRCSVIICRRSTSTALDYQAGAGRIRRWRGDAHGSHRGGSDERRPAKPGVADPQPQPAPRIVLQGIYAAESVGVAMAETGRLEPGESIITRQGVWVGPDWIRRYAVAEEEAGIIQRAQELDTLNLRVEEAEKTLGRTAGSRLAEGRTP